MVAAAARLHLLVNSAPNVHGKVLCQPGDIGTQRLRWIERERFSVFAARVHGQPLPLRTARAYIARAVGQFGDLKRGGQA